jgi:hypothetical protein
MSMILVPAGPANTLDPRSATACAAGHAGAERQSGTFRAPARRAGDCFAALAMTGGTVSDAVSSGRRLRHEAGRETPSRWLPWAGPHDFLKKALPRRGATRLKLQRRDNSSPA